jgi:hypothetical protein
LPFFKTGVNAPGSPSAVRLYWNGYELPFNAGSYSNTFKSFDMEVYDWTADNYKPTIAKFNATVGKGTTVISLGAVFANNFTGLIDPAAGKVPIVEKVPPLGSYARITTRDPPVANSPRSRVIARWVGM